MHSTASTKHSVQHTRQRKIEKKKNKRAVPQCKREKRAKQAIQPASEQASNRQQQQHQNANKTDTTSNWELLERSTNLCIVCAYRKKRYSVNTLFKIYVENIFQHSEYSTACMQREKKNNRSKNCVYRNILLLFFCSGFFRQFCV